jgi:hypothetical protein
MNERIKELLVQSGLLINVSEHRVNELDPNIKKFAELIVGHATECVRDVLRDENSDLSYVAAGQVQNRITEFFGVKE